MKSVLIKVLLLFIFAAICISAETADHIVVSKNSRAFKGMGAGMRKKMSFMALTTFKIKDEEIKAVIREHFRKTFQTKSGSVHDGWLTNVEYWLLLSSLHLASNAKKQSLGFPTSLFRAYQAIRVYSPCLTKEKNFSSVHAKPVVTKSERMVRP
jgi:hypothetical protein